MGAGAVNNWAKCVLWVCACVAVVTLLTAGGCRSSEPLAIMLAEDVERPVPRVMIFFVDGVSLPVLDEMRARGEAPNIQKYLYENGLSVEHAVTVIPSITYAVTATFSTGLYPGHHDIVGNKWFDRFSLIKRNYNTAGSYRAIDHDLRVPTMYELLDQQYSVVTQSANRLGATRSYDNWMKTGISWFFGDLDGVDIHAVHRVREATRHANAVGRFPELVMVYMPATDAIGHRYGSDSEEYRRQLRHVDRQIGRVCRGLAEADMLDDTYLVFISDHGHAVTVDEQHCDVQQDILSKLGLESYEGSTDVDEPVEKRVRRVNRYRVVMCNGGDRRCAIHLRSGKWWHEVPGEEDVDTFVQRFGKVDSSHTPDLRFIEYLAANPAVCLAGQRLDDGTIRLVGSGGESVVRRRLDSGVTVYQYEVLRSPDPLGYRNDDHAGRLLDGGWHDSRAWLEATCRADMPDVVVQIVEYFDSPRAGQLVLFAADGWDFNVHNRWRGGHGSVLRTDMHIPFVVAGPGIEPGSRQYTSRAVDLVPTVLHLLDADDVLEQTGAMDGQVLEGMALDASSNAF